MYDTNLDIIKLSSIETKEIEWLWYPYIPYGKITVLQGDPGSGKTMLILYLSALISSGSPLPFINQKQKPSTVIYQTSEDGYDDTIKPRLESFGIANLDNIIFINEEVQSLSMLDERIEMAISSTQAKLFVLDPIQAYIGNNIDINRANEIRPLLKNLGTIAQKYNVAIVLIGHMNKAKGIKSSYRNLGSIDIPAAARSVLICGELKNDDNLHVVIQDKCSLAARGKPFAYKLDKENGFQWIGEYDIDADELLNGSIHKTAKEQAKDFLLDLLSHGPHKANNIIKHAKERGISKRTLDQAKSELNIKSKKDGSFWIWYLQN